MPQELTPALADTDLAGTKFVLWSSGSRFRTSGPGFLTGPVLTGFTGFQFPAIQVPSSDPNTLDDYEEGLWTPSFGTTGVPFTSVGYGAREGDYEKVGRLVRASGHITVNALTVGAASGNLQISGLPFSSSGTPPSSISIGYITAFTTNTPMSGFTTGTSINLYHRTAVTGGAVPSTFAVLSATSDIYFNVVYRV